MKAVGDYNIIKPQQETVTSAGIIIQGDTTGVVTKGIVESISLSADLRKGDTVYYFKNTAYAIPGCDLVAVESKNIVAAERA